MSGAAQQASLVESSSSLMRIVIAVVAASLCSACQGLEPPVSQTPEAEISVADLAPPAADTDKAQETTEPGAAETGGEVTAETAAATQSPASPPSSPPASAPTPAPAPVTEKPRHLELTGLRIPPAPTVGDSVPAALSYAGNHEPTVKRVCFLWSGDGPYCWDYFSVERDDNKITTSLTMKEARSYELQAYVEYETAGKLYKSNVVSASVTAQP